MANKQLPMQVGYEHVDQKIDRKVDKETFQWVIGIIVGIIITMIGIAVGASFYFVFKYNDSLNGINEKLVRLETKFDDNMKTIR